MSWSPSRWLRRAALFAPAVGCLLLALLLAGAASSQATLACDRAAGRCDWTRRAWHGARSATFAIADVREVRLVEGLGKYHRQAETALIFSSGRELRLARDDADRARARHAALDAFFSERSAGQGGQAASLRDDTGAPAWLFAAAVAALIAAVALAVRAARQRVPDRVAPAVGGSVRRLVARTDVRVVAGLVALVLVAQLAMMLVADRTQGTLELDCRSRCRFEGGECLPGGQLRAPLDPGEHTIEVWAASGPTRWIPRRFSIVVGEVTRVVCE